jgi:hypothetical protein
MHKNSRKRDFRTRWFQIGALRSYSAKVNQLFKVCSCPAISTTYRGTAHLQLSQSTGRWEVSHKSVTTDLTVFNDFDWPIDSWLDDQHNNAANLRTVYNLKSPLMACQITTILSHTRTFSISRKAYACSVLMPSMMSPKIQTIFV